MTTKQSHLSLFIITLLSFLGIAMWLYEMVEIQQWHSLAWLYNPLYSPFAVTFIVVSSFLTAVFVTGEFLSAKRLLVCFALLYLLSGVCYWFGKTLCYFIYTMISPPVLWWVLIIAFVVLVFLFHGVAYWAVLNYTILKNKKRNILLISLFSFLAVPFSLLTIRCYEGFGSGNDWVDAVKMGYPIFWMTFFMGIAGIVIIKRHRSG